MSCRLDWRDNEQLSRTFTIGISGVIVLLPVARDGRLPYHVDVIATCSPLS